MFDKNTDRQRGVDGRRPDKEARVDGGETRAMRNKGKVVSFEREREGKKQVGERKEAM